MITDFFAALSCIVLPYIAGRIVVRQSFLAFLFGSLYYFGLFLALSLFSFGTVYITLLRIFIIVTTAIGMGMILKTPFLFPKRRSLLPVVGIVILSILVFFFIWRRETPYPFQLNWDIYEHLTLINIIRNGTFSFFTSKLSDTFTFSSYPTFFHTILALPLLFGGTSLGLYWWLEYFHYLAVICVTYWFTKEISGGNKPAILVATATSALTFESFMVYESLFFLPQTLAAVIAIGLLTLVYRGSISKKALAFGILSLLLLHFVIGSAAALLILVIYGVMKIDTRKKNILRIGMLLSLIVFITAFCSTFFIHWNVLGREEAAHFNLSLLQKGSYFFDWYAGLLLFIPLALFTIVRKTERKLAGLVIIFFLTSAIVFSPFAYVLKYHVLSRFFLHALIGIGAAYIISRLPGFMQKLALIALFAIAVLLFFENQASYKSSLGYKGRFAHFSSGEMEAARWLSEHKNSNWLLVSDPATQYILEGLSGVNSQGGAFMDNRTRKLLVAASYQKDPALILSKLRMVNDLLEPSFSAKRIFVITGRYEKWQDLQDDWQESSYYNIWRPYAIDKQGRELRDALLTEPHVKLLYQNEEVIVLSI